MASTDNLADPLADFTFSLYHQATAFAGDGQNVIVSPFSVSFALAMTYAGAAGNTKEQLKKLLLGDSQHSGNNLHGSYSYAGLMELLNRPDAPYKLHIANRLCAHVSFVEEVLPTFVDLLENFYKSQLYSKDFSKRAEEARQEINGWVSDATNGKISDLLAPGSLVGARLVLINAVYFKGNWDDQFDAEKTTKSSFHASEDKELTVDMMHKYNRKYRYAENGACQVLGIAYQGKELFMYLFLPKERFGLKALEGCLTGAAVLELIKTAAEEQLKELSIPKLKLEQSLALNDALKNMGATDMFEEANADFSNINGKRDLFVSDVIHKAFIEVNEEGTEAAAATAVTVTKRCAPLKPAIEFIADHPFLFTIFDQRSMGFLFVGRYCG